MAYGPPFVLWYMLENTTWFRTPHNHEIIAYGWQEAAEGARAGYLPLLPPAGFTHYRGQAYNLYAAETYAPWRRVQFIELAQTEIVTPGAPPTYPPYAEPEEEYYPSAPFHLAYMADDGQWFRTWAYHATLEEARRELAEAFQVGFVDVYAYSLRFAEGYSAIAGSKFPVHRLDLIEIIGQGTTPPAGSP